MEDIDHVVYSFNLKVHAFDNDSLTEMISAFPVGTMDNLSRIFLED